MGYFKCERLPPHGEPHDSQGERKAIRRGNQMTDFTRQYAHTEHHHPPYRKQHTCQKPGPRKTTSADGQAWGRGAWPVQMRWCTTLAWPRSHATNSAVLEPGLLFPLEEDLLCCAMPCHTMPSHATPCHPMPCHAMPCYAMPFHAMLCSAVLCCAIMHHKTQNTWAQKGLSGALLWVFKPAAGTAPQEIVADR